MNDIKCIGLDVHQATISAAVLDSTGKLVMECVLETKAATILQFIHGLRGSLHVTAVGEVFLTSPFIELQDLASNTQKSRLTSLRGEMVRHRKVTRI